MIGFLEFGDALEAATGSDRRATIAAQAHAYLKFALARPGLFRLMWRTASLDLDDPQNVVAARRAFAISDRAVRGREAVFTSAGDPALAPTIACWSMVHGFVALVLDGAFSAGHLRAAEGLDAVLDTVLTYLDLERESD